MKTENKKDNKLNASIYEIVELTQELAQKNLEATVETQKVAEKFTQEVTESIFAVGEANAKVAKTYLSNLSQVQKSWMKLYTEAAEKTIKTPFNFEVPMQKEIIEFNKEFFNQAQKAFETASTK